MTTNAKTRCKTATKKPARNTSPAKPFFSPNEKTVLVLRTCSADMTSYGGFVWPESGPVWAPDWSPVAECGSGLHGFLWGAGDGSLASFEPHAKWLVVRVAETSIVDLRGKAKFPRGIVEFCGSRLDATNYIRANGSREAVIGAYVTSGHYGTSTSGYGGTSTSGDRGTSTSGHYGTSTSGDGGTSTSGYGGTSTSGYGGTSTSGDRGTLVLAYRTRDRKRLVVLYVGENGILPNVPYRLDDDGKPVRADGK